MTKRAPGFNVSKGGALKGKHLMAWIPGEDGTSNQADNIRLKVAWQYVCVDWRQPRRYRLPHFAETGPSQEAQ